MADGRAKARVQIQVWQGLITLRQVISAHTTRVVFQERSETYILLKLWQITTLVQSCLGL